MSQLSEKPVEQAQETHGDAGNLIVFDLRTLTHFREDEPYVQVLSDIGGARLVLFAFKAGQQLREHSTPSQILVQALRGRLLFTAAGQGIKLQAGTVLQMEANIPHAVVAQTDAVMLLTIIPSPENRSLGRDAFQGLTPLVTRTVGASED
ncbi:MAG TPA: cupin domain-containing protein [Ktedonobacteraceae bacterium]|jgi:quercetin dioxygenase-like cupin family protein|nr:cupin domain-containing protein [Ktedonobacteraceae bacterium]